MAVSISEIQKEKVKKREEIRDNEYYELIRHDPETGSFKSCVVQAKSNPQKLQWPIVRREYWKRDHGLGEGDWIFFGVLLSCDETYLEKEDQEIIPVALLKFWRADGKCFQENSIFHLVISREGGRVY